MNLCELFMLFRTNGRKYANMVYKTFDLILICSAMNGCIRSNLLYGRNCNLIRVLNKVCTPPSK